MSHVLKDLYLSSTTPADYIKAATRRVADLVSGLDAAAIVQVIETIATAASRGNSIFTIANGGSAVVASHFVNDLGVNSWVPGERGYKVYCLADNVASVTAVANDVSFASIFTRQLECSLEPGDVLIAMSVSGNSENIVQAVEYANGAGAVTVGFCGFDGGRLAKVAQQLVHIPSGTDEYGPVEDMFSVTCHLISSYLTMQRGRFLHH